MNIDFSQVNTRDLMEMRAHLKDNKISYMSIVGRLSTGSEEWTKWNDKLKGVEGAIERVQQEIDKRLDNIHGAQGHQHQELP